MLATINLDVTEFLVNVTEKDHAGKVVSSWNGTLGMPTHTVPTAATRLRLRCQL